MNTTATPENTNITPVPPAISLPLTGQHLIEASAGTGKTWTLTGVLLRLLIEAGHPCDKIIATTFTRSAAAEMRQRIRERLNDLYQLLQITVQHNLMNVVQDANDSDAAVEKLMAWLKTKSYSRGLKSAFDDPINQHLLRWIAKQVFGSLSQFQPPELQESNHTSANEKQSVDSDSQQAVQQPTQAPNKNTSEKNASKSKIDFRIALQRTNAALNQLDRLFVSTLDSLCQKWLREFSSETGFSADVQISNDVDGIIHGMIHDQLRAFWAHLYEHEPEVYQLMQANNKLLSAKDFYPAVNKALNFYTAPIDRVAVTPIDLTAIPKLMQRIADFKDEQFNQYLDKDFRKKQGLDGRKGLAKNFNNFPKLQEVLPTATLDFLLNFEEDFKAEFAFIKYVVSFYDNGEGFNDNSEEGVKALKSFSIIQDIRELERLRNNLINHIDDINRYFTQFISRYVRDNLPQVLEAQRLTTFSLQLARLNRALQGQQGEALARYIRHQYPVALIDESQDINTEQALLIQRIYLEEFKDKPSTKKTIQQISGKSEPLFLLLVGDPKQAIYGFRGGDVNNYTTLKKLFKTKAQSLTFNRRSSKGLIETLNHWYGVPDSQNPQQLVDTSNHANVYQLPFYLGESIYYQHITATRKWPSLFDAKNINLPTFYQIHLPAANEEEATMGEDEAVTAEILSLMQLTQNFQLYMEDGEREVFDTYCVVPKRRPLLLSDICILADKGKHLDAVERKLHKAGIATIRGGNQSVFGDIMSQDLLTLMSLLLTPYNKAKLKALMLTSFFQLTLNQTNQLIESETLEPLATALQTSNSVDNTQLLDTIQATLTHANELWQKENFLVAIQWLLNEKLTLPEQPTLTFWQRLARHKEGERLLIDLRQILDLISEQFIGQVVGEYQLFDWLKNMIQLAPKEEWALQQRLPSESGVQLMTIHRSKGLEFPIVFIMGMDDSLYIPPNKSPLFLYTNPDNAQPSDSLLSRRLTANVTTADNTIDFKAGEKDNVFEERLRLLYVALTRARERVYLVTSRPSRATSESPLTAFIESNKTFELLPTLQDIIAKTDLNSLSKLKNNNLKDIQKNTEDDAKTNKQYEEIMIPKLDYAFEGWANTSFTALSRFVKHDRQEMAIHEADYDGFDEDVITLDDIYQPVITNVENPQHDNRLNIEPDYQDKLLNTDTSYQDERLIDSHYNEAMPINEIDDTVFIDHGDSVTLEDLQSMDDLYAAMEDASDFGYNANALIDNSYDEPVIEDFSLLFEPIETAPQFHPIQDETDLIRFRFEKGTAAGTFLHKVLEDLANNHFDDLHDTFTEGGFWLPPARWAMIIDRALRQQQLPAPYFSTLASSEGIFLGNQPIDVNQLQPEYLALAGWLNDVIHTPFGATGQQTVAISHYQKSAEMGFNMRLNRQLSLKSLNTLFTKYGVELQLREDFTPNAMWQYLRGEIDLVYQHNEKYYIVDYKSNYLGSHFADYHTDALHKAMSEHSYWLQASIYQVALHRFLQMRLADYQPEKYLGAVEYAFIRGMSLQHPGYGSIVWEPKIEFILELDALFGY